MLKRNKSLATECMYWGFKCCNGHRKLPYSSVQRLTIYCERTLEPRSARDKGNVEFEFPVFSLDDASHVTANTGCYWWVIFTERQPCLNGLIPACGRTDTTYPMFLSKSWNNLALFLTFKPWKLTEILFLHNPDLL